MTTMKAVIAGARRAGFLSRSPVLPSSAPPADRGMQGRAAPGERQAALQPSEQVTPSAPAAAPFPANPLTLIS